MMGTMSAAEARLDAAIRPEITVLRSRTSYPPRRRPPTRPAQPGRSVGLVADAGQVSGPRAIGHLAAVPAPGPLASDRPAVAMVMPPRPATTGTRAFGPQRQPARRSAPLRLTRRGRAVLIAIGIIVAVALSSLIWLAVAGQAQASNHLRPGGPATHGMVRVVVQPGDTLWSIAVRADPTADPRAVIQEITDVNSLSGAGIGVGEVLWVPRG